MEHEETTAASRNRGEPEWSSLLGRVLDDFSHVLQMEARLFEANLGQVLIGIVDRALGQVLLIGALLAGGCCLLGALIMGLHTFLPWWAAFAIAGGGVMVGGMAGYLAMQRVATRQENRASIPSC
ncbi:MAG TPA: phage holin family protein [Candidatus Binataceae bacterium]|nr:phage holin family protein [Candidatus Binataceae bacterium]